MRTKKEYLLGIDVTPRRALYIEIEALEEGIARLIVEKNNLYKEMIKLNVELANARVEADRLRSRRGKDGCFVKRNK